MTTGYRDAMGVVLAAALLVGGCALAEDRIAVDYAPDANSGISALPGAAGATLSPVLSDKRKQFTDRVSTKRNGYGMEMARIVSTKDVPAIVLGAVEQEFKTLGFVVGPGGLSVTVEVVNFYNNFRTGILSGSAQADVSFGVRVKNAAGAPLYTKFYSGSGTIEPVFLASGDNAKQALEKALASAVEQMADDKALQRVLLIPVQPLDGKTGRSS
jgi:uncharacterized lipoprotein